MWTKWWHHSFILHIVHGKVALIAISLHLLYMSTVLPGSWWCWRHWLGTLIILGVETLVIVAVYKAGMFDVSWIYVQWWQRVPHTCTTYLWSTSSTLRLFGSSVSRLLVRLVSSLGITCGLWIKCFWKYVSASLRFAIFRQCVLRAWVGFHVGDAPHALFSWCVVFEYLIQYNYYMSCNTGWCCFLLESSFC